VLIAMCLSLVLVVASVSGWISRCPTSPWNMGDIGDGRPPVDPAAVDPDSLARFPALRAHLRV